MEAPYKNCQYQICDLPGQCKGEGKCHHPVKDHDELTALRQQVERTNQNLNAVENVADELKEQLALRDLEIVDLRKALNGILPFVVTQVVACNGLKCRESVCESCSINAEQSAQEARNKYETAHKALTQTINPDEWIRKSDLELIAYQYETKTEVDGWTSKTFSVSKEEISNPDTVNVLELYRIKDNK